MKNKLICLLLALAMVFGMLAVLVACGGGGEEPTPDNTVTPGGNTGTDPGKETHDHVDANNDGKCDVCGEAFHKHVDEDNNGKCDICGKAMIGPDKSQDDGWWNGITYDTTNLIFQLTECSNKEELPSGCKRFMAGDPDLTGDLDDQIALRNEQTAFLTKTKITYRYYPDSAEYGWSQNINTIFQAVQTKTPDTPDMFCNFMTDMLCSSLLGSFANLYSQSRGTNYMDIDAKGEIDFEDDYFESGYMDDLMASLTLSLSKIYVIASDYFIDLIRAFFIVPVNRALYDSIAGETIDDLNGDGKKDIGDLFVEVRNGDWTYERLAQYSTKIYSNESNQTTINLGDIVGFAVDASSGLSTAGLLYTSSVSIISKTWNNTTYDYDYQYPETNPDLLAFVAAEYKLFDPANGVLAVTNEIRASYGETALQAIRNRFAENKVLFGGVILLGSLEYSQYQNMKKADGTGGFGIVPVPVYREGDNYLTQIHVVGRAGGIAQCTTNFTQCTAFLQYQSTHSSKILDDYYNIELMYNTVDTSISGNIEILRFIRANVRTSFDKLFEDAIGFFYETTNPDSVKARWHAILITNDAYPGTPYRRTDMAEIYEKLYHEKQGHLKTLVQEYEKLPD